MNKFELLYPGKSSFHKLDINKKNEIENLIDTYDKKKWKNRCYCDYFPKE